MHSLRSVLPVVLLLAWCESAQGADSSAETPQKPVPPAKAAEARAVLDELGLGSLAYKSGPGGATDQGEFQSRMAALRARAAAGDASAAEAAQALAQELGVESSNAKSPARLWDEEKVRAKVEEMRARVAAGESSVTERIVGLETTTDVTITPTRTSITTRSAVDPAEMRTKLEEWRARAAAGESGVAVTFGAKRLQRTTEMTDEERARRQAYVASHPDLPPRSKEMILAGLFLLAMKFEDVEQLLGPLQSAEGHLPEGVVLDPEVKAYTAQESGRTVYLLFRDGKLVRR